MYNWLHANEMTFHEKTQTFASNPSPPAPRDTTAFFS